MIAKDTVSMTALSKFGILEGPNVNCIPFEIVGDNPVKTWSFSVNPDGIIRSVFVM